jgi:cell wall assembly regulator SMI1
MDINQSWDIIDSTLKAKFSKIAKTLNDGATTAELAKLEQALGMTLPDDLKQSLMRHNGQTDPTFQYDMFNFNRLLTVDEIIAEHATLNKLFENRGPIAGLKADKIKTVMWSTQWIKFTESDSDGYVVDMDPAANGVSGQVFYRRHDDKVTRPVAQSYREFLAMVAKRLSTGRYEIDLKHPVMDDLIYV